MALRTNPKIGFVPNKQEFKERIYINMAKKDINHILKCKLDGYETMRQNNVRDMMALLLTERNIDV